jgi:hypothetical protein
MLRAKSLNNSRRNEPPAASGNIAFDAIHSWQMFIGLARSLG